MLTDALKQTIRDTYRQFLLSRGLRPRQGQKLMIADIANTIGTISGGGERDHPDVNRHICVVEAGTGTGKTIAYLIAAIPLAQALNKKLVVSTATVALQEQIIYKDLPDLQNHTELRFNFSIAKGRGRYLCLSKLDLLLQNREDSINPPSFDKNDHLFTQEQFIDEQTVNIYRDMLSAITTGEWDGDRDSWPQSLEQKEWTPVTTNHRQCAGRRCSQIGGCSFFKARESLDSVDCIVANHDLVLADLALGGGVILPKPEDTLYIFDEGHHLPDKALSHFSHHTRVNATARWLEESHKSLRVLLEEIGNAGQITHYAEPLPAIFNETKQQLDTCFPYCRQLIDEQLPVGNTSNRDNAKQYCFKAGKATTALREMADGLTNSFGRMAGILDRIVLEMQEAMEDDFTAVPKVDLEKWLPWVGAWQMRVDANLALWHSYSMEDEACSLPRARWLTMVEFSDSEDIEICSSPILAADNLTTALWDRCFGAVVTSASLTAFGQFDRFKMRAGTGEDGHYTIVPSPFDCSNALLQVPANAVEANHVDQHTESVIVLLPQLLGQRYGSLVLFASRRQMHAVCNGLPKKWQSCILMQGDHSKQSMLKKHKERIDSGQSSVLFGLASFSEGVDLPGDYCRHVIIAKLPFAVPDNPVEKALSEWIESRGGNAFMEITVPDAALKLLQACGRLLRTETDTGTISILDKRILTKRYGRDLINSLPPYKRQW